MVCWTEPHDQSTGYLLTTWAGVDRLSEAAGRRFGLPASGFELYASLDAFGDGAQQPIAERW
jgi:hypothetical protein